MYVTFDQPLDRQVSPKLRQPSRRLARGPLEHAFQLAVADPQPKVLVFETPNDRQFGSRVETLPRLAGDGDRIQQRRRQPLGKLLDRGFDLFQVVTQIDDRAGAERAGTGPRLPTRNLRVRTGR